MECFVKIVNGFKLLTVFPKPFILDVWQGSEYASYLRKTTLYTSQKKWLMLHYLYVYFEASLDVVIILRKN